MKHDAANKQDMSMYMYRIAGLTVPCPSYRNFVVML